MECKKNPEIEINRFGSLYFLVGLAIMMLFTYIGLEHKSYESKEISLEIVSFADSYNVDFEDDIPVMKMERPATTAPAIAIAREGITVIDNLAIIEETVMESTEMSQMDIVGEVKEYDAPVLRVNDIIIKDVEDDIDIPFSAIESAPVFPGCEKGTKQQIKECFQKKMKEHVAKNFVYPELAKELGMQGKVFILFTIDTKGVVSKVQTRGPDKILEKEAERIISLLPKMIPGKQRGKPARVSYSIPINFRYMEN